MVVRFHLIDPISALNIVEHYFPLCSITSCLQGHFDMHKLGSFQTPY